MAKQSVKKVKVEQIKMWALHTPLGSVVQVTPDGSTAKRWRDSFKNLKVAAGRFVPTQPAKKGKKNGKR